MIFISLCAENGQLPNKRFKHVNRVTTNFSKLPLRYREYIIICKRIQVINKGVSFL